MGALPIIEHGAHGMVCEADRATVALVILPFKMTGNTSYRLSPRASLVFSRPAADARPEDEMDPSHSQRVYTVDNRSAMML